MPNPRKSPVSHKYSVGKGEFVYEKSIKPPNFLLNSVIISLFHGKLLAICTNLPLPLKINPISIGLDVNEIINAYSNKKTIWLALFSDGF
jgi:hypothetical protein